MSVNNTITVEYSSELIPVKPDVSGDFFDDVHAFASKISTERQEKVAEDTPLLASKTAPYYEQTDILTPIAYSIELENIYGWMRYFLTDTESPPQKYDTVSFKIPSEYYEHFDDALFIKTDTEELVFEFKQQPEIDLNKIDAILSITHSESTGDITLSIEEDAEISSDDMTKVISTDEFPTTYDQYQAQLDGSTVEEHQPFAIYSPAVSFETATELAETQCDDTLTIVTNDDWKVCVKSTEDTDYVVDVSIVELLNPVSDTIVEYYDDFAYSTDYIHLPEMQYIHSLPEAHLNEDDEQLLRTLPYAIPFGDESELFAKLTHAQDFNENQIIGESFERLAYGQFIGE